MVKLCNCVSLALSDKGLSVLWCVSYNEWQWLVEVSVCHTLIKTY